jgi:hypothetical protein
MVNFRPRPLYPQRKKPPYPLVRWLVGPQSGSIKEYLLPLVTELWAFSWQCADIPIEISRLI